MIHPTAIVNDLAEIAPGVEIGPYSVIGAGVRIGAGTVIGPHVTAEGPMRIGENCRIFQFCSLGAPPQDLKYLGESSEVIIGNGNTLREYVTVNRGTKGGGMKTVLGDNNLIMAYSHVAHDCIIGNSVVLANCANLAGHIVIDDCAIVGGLVGVHQFVRIGTHAMIGGLSGVQRDVPPYTMAAGQRATLHGLNATGLKRRGFSATTISELKAAYKIFFRSGLTVQKAVAQVRDAGLNSPEVLCLTDFITASQRGVIRE